jgi:hypothetical protein
MQRLIINQSIIDCNDSASSLYSPAESRNFDNCSALYDRGLFPESAEYARS